tara:strand:+ start:946 stop:2085 length:1140 start_codon:yes stop_codon:yes gene_type:complete
MVVEQILLNKFRHFHYSHFTFNPKTNLLVGRNGSGKTSILEALYYLAYAKSFRSRSAHTLISHDASCLQIDAKIQTPQHAHFIQSAYGSNKSDCSLKMDHDAGVKQSEIAKLLPVVFIDTSTHREFSQTPKNRRDYVNWCCFYTASAYHTDLAKYQRVLQQRNQLLKQQKLSGQNMSSQIASWTEPLIHYGQRVHEARLDIIASLNAQLMKHWSYFFSFDSASIEYHPGWNTAHSYSDCLQQALAQDIQYGYTQNGPHRADIHCMTHQNELIFQTFSQGQQKLFSYLLRFIQLDLVAKENRSHRLLLIDDLPAELDVDNQGKILDYLQNIDCQKFITALSSEVFDKKFTEQAIYVDAPKPNQNCIEPVDYRALTIQESS